MDRDNLVGDIVTPLAQVRREAEDGLLRRQCRALAAHPRRVQQVRRPSRTSRRLDAEVRPRCRIGSAGVRRHSTLVTNCMVLTEGWDMPEVSCCILARPTRKWVCSANGRPRAAAGAGQGQRDRARPLRRSVSAWLRRGSCRVDAGSREPGDQPEARCPGASWLHLALAGMHQVRLDPRRRRGLPALRLPTAASAEGHRFRRWRPGSGRP